MTTPQVPDRRASTASLPEPSSLVPLLAEIITAWHRHEAEIATWDDAERLVACSRSGWQGLVQRLQLINTFQWHEEDRSRDPRASDATLAAVKRSIDASNSRRVRAVELLDEHVHAELARAGLLVFDAPVPSETPGSIVDRLTVLALKVHHSDEALLSAAPADREHLIARLELLREQMDDLCASLLRQLADVVAGRLRLKLYRQVKIYGHGPSADA